MATNLELLDKLTLLIPPRENWPEAFKGLTKYLSEALGVSVSLQVASDFDEVRRRIARGSGDLAVFTASEYVLAKERHPEIIYLATAKTAEAGEPRAAYEGFIVTRKDNGIASLEDLKGRRFGFVSRTSTSGYKFPLAFLLGRGIDPQVSFGSVLFVGDHSKVTDAVATGSVEAGATWDVNLREAIIRHGDIFSALATYGPITNHALVGRPGLPDALIGRLVASVSTLPAEVTRIAHFPYSGFQQLPDASYDATRQVVKLVENRPTARSKMDALALTTGEFRQIVVDKLLDLLLATRIRAAAEAAGDFVKRETTPLLRQRSLDELVTEAENQSGDLAQRYPTYAPLIAELSPILERLKDEAGTPSDTLDLFNDLVDVEGRWLNPLPPGDADLFTVGADADRIRVDSSADSLSKGSFVKALAEDAAASLFLASVSDMNEDVREKGRSTTRDERASLRAAYAMLAKGRTIPGAYRPLGVSGFRDIQTYLFNTDPGEGHISVNCRDMALLVGTTIHVEHIDRDQESDKEKVEPYRLPAALNAAKVRLHVGTHAPCSAYIGRPVFESGAFKLDRLKAVHMTASACTAMFMNGIVDCKIAIERMTASEAIEFMQSVAGNVMRDKSRQLLSAAFNINTQIVDDRPETIAAFGGHAIIVRDRMEIGRLGIELASVGGFDKVTWDGASNEVPSRPIIGQLDYRQLLELVHSAHTRGLNTYVSAGLKAVHMRDGVHLGIDGVGIGTSLHYIDPATKLMGALKPDAIRETLRVRDEAVQEPFGRAGALLARLDRLYFEGALSVSQDDDRLELYEKLLTKDEPGTVALLDRLADVVEMPVTGDHPLIARARRLVASRPSDNVLSRELPGFGWAAATRRIEEIARNGDVKQLSDLLTAINVERARSGAASTFASTI